MQMGKRKDVLAKRQADKKKRVCTVLNSIYVTERI